MADQLQQLKIENPFADKQIVIYDIEVYKNLFLALFYEPDGSFKYFPISATNALKNYLNDPNKILVGYNNLGYDDLILKAIIAGWATTEQEIYTISQEIINRDPECTRPKNLRYRVKHSWFRSIDLMQLCFKSDDHEGGLASLKELAIRLKWPKIQDLPYPFDAELTADQKRNIQEYCKNDVLITATLWNKLHNHVVLRRELEKQFNVDVFTLSEAQTCETLFLELYKHGTGYDRSTLTNFRARVDEINIAEIIPEWIGFQSQYLKDFLDELKEVTITRNTKGNLEKSILSKKLQVGSKKYNFGAGGLHSEDQAGIFESDQEYQIIDVDVTSFYPAIMLRNNTHPSHLTSLWTNILRQLTEKRIAAKRAGDKLVSDALKIVINSAFGKTGNKYSFMHDPKVLLSVTITGELSLLNLIERFVRENIIILSANTDGITVKLHHTQRGTFDQIKADWEAYTQFSLEETAYKKYIRQDVNNYLAIKKNGTIKKKGLFVQHSLFKKSDEEAVTRAIVNYFTKGIPVEETILNQERVYQFCYSYKTARNFKTLYNGGQELQRTNRWYVALDGQKIFKRRISDGSVISLPDGEKARLANDLNGGAIPDDLNYNHYIAKAEKIIFKIESAVVAEKITKLGLAPIPKEAKKNPQGARLNYVKSDWDYGKYAGLGCYTGEFCGIIAIDIDEPERCQVSHLFTDSLVIWHGSATREDVLNCRKRGTILYRCENSLLKTTKKQFQKKHGFEVIYGGKSVQLFGLHKSGEKYIYSGSLADIPTNLEEWLLHNAPKKKVKSVDNTGDLFEDEKYEATSDDHERLKIIVSMLLPGWDYSEIKDSTIGYKLQGHSPFGNDHSTRSTSREFNIFFLDNGLPYAKSYHDSDTNEAAELTKKLHNAWQDAKKLDTRSEKLKEINLKPLPVPKTEELSSIADALRSKKRHIAVNSPTGSGKTYQSALYFLECLVAKIPVCFVSGNRTDQQAFVDLVEELSGLTVDDIFTQVLRGGEHLQDEIDKDGNMKIAKSTLGIVTHHTYLQRKGPSNIFYTFLQWVKDNKPVMIIDEADSYCEKITQLLTIGGRYTRRYNKGARFATYIKVDTCPAFAGSGNCANCYYYKRHQSYNVNDFQIPEISEAKRIDQPDIDKPTNRNPFSLPNLPILHVKQLGYLEVKKIQQHKSLSRKAYRFFLKDGEVYDSKTSIQDMVDSSFNPVIYKAWPMYQGAPIHPHDITEEIKNEVKFPYQPCQVPHLSLKDQAPIEWLRRHASKTRWLSATFGPTNLSFLQESLEDKLDIVKIKTSPQKIDELLILGIPKRITFVQSKKGQRKVYFSGLEEQGKILIFEPKQSAAKDLFRKVPSSYPMGCYYDDSVKVNEKFAGGKWKALITHSRGPLGRAINLPDFFSCFIHGNIYKPSIAFDLEEFTEEELMIRREEDRHSFIMQNAGRILRGNEGRKVIVLQYATDADIKAMKYFMQCMVRQEIKIGFFEHDQGALRKSILHFFETGEFVSEEKSLMELAKQGLSKLNEKQRSQINKEEHEQSKKQTKWEKTKVRLEELKTEGLNWTKASTKLHIRRDFTKEEKQELKEFYNST